MKIEMTPEGDGLPAIIRNLERAAGNDWPGEKRQLMKDASLRLRRESFRNANISPTKAQYEAKYGKTNRTFEPGGLQDSIRSESGKDWASVFVPENSDAGQYAYYIHSLKHKPGGWRKRGIGTVAKGKRADHKFIERAIKDYPWEQKLIGMLKRITRKLEK